MPKNQDLAWGGVDFFILSLVNLFGLAYPENLSSIGLMVEAVDTLCGTARDKDGDGHGHRHHTTKSIHSLNHKSD